MTKQEFTQYLEHFKPSELLEKAKFIQKATAVNANMAIFYATNFNGHEIYIDLRERNQHRQLKAYQHGH
jgi:hypothetical protein